MRPKFETLMKDIHLELVEMGQLIEQALNSARAAFMDANPKKAAKTKRYEYKIDKKEKEIERLCVHVLLTQQPVAGDLRLITAALRMIADMERIGDQCEDISDIALSMERSGTFNTESLDAMFKSVRIMVSDSVNSFVESDLRLANSVILSDDVVDGYFKEIRQALIERISVEPRSAAQWTDILMVIKYLERIADHACSIAEWVIYSITGKHNTDEGETDG